MRIPFKFSESKQTFAGGFGEMQFASGPPGKSAYEIAVQEGFDGTKEEWLESLKGKPGKPGATGNDGVSATHSWNGTTLTITSASGTSSANLKGPKGDDGKTPVKGEDYYTPDDVAEMVASVIAALPVYNGEVIEE